MTMDREARSAAVMVREARSAAVIESSEVCRVCGKSHGAVPCPDQATQVAMSQASLAPGSPPPALPEAAAIDRSGDLIEGTLVGQYRVLHRVGEGGMGVVYAAVHPLIGKKVAIKVLNSAGSHLEGAAARFLQEARAAALGQHPNLIQAFDFGQLTDSRYYLVMEFLEGESLSTYLRRHGPLSYRAALPILDGILGGLKAAHDKGIVHRDLKPENAWICSSFDSAQRDQERSRAPSIDGTTPAPPADGAPGSQDEPAVTAARIKLLDFGLAKLVAAGPAGQDSMLTRAGTPMGTPAFMSPEQCRGLRDIDHRTDIYSLGIIMWELFTGQLPFRGDSYVDVLHQHMTAALPSLGDLCGMPPDLESVIYRALAKSPADRFDSAAELRAALHGCTLAADFAPHRRVPSAQSPKGANLGLPLDAQTVVGAAADAFTMAVPPHPSSDSDSDSDGGFYRPALLPLDTGAFQVEPGFGEDGGHTMTLTLRGSLEPEDTAALVEYLRELIEPIRSGVRRVVLDLRPVEYLDVQAMAHLGDWLGVLRDLREEGLAPTTVRYSESMPHQRLLVPRLERVDPALRLESMD